jgi:hypothetical protein
LENALLEQRLHLLVNGWRIVVAIRVRTSKPLLNRSYVQRYKTFLKRIKLRERRGAIYICEVAAETLPLYCLQASILRGNEAVIRRKWWREVFWWADGSIVP